MVNPHGFTKPGSVRSATPAMSPCKFVQSKCPGTGDGVGLADCPRALPLKNVIDRNCSPQMERTATEELNPNRVIFMLGRQNEGTRQPSMDRRVPSHPIRLAALRFIPGNSGGDKNSSANGHELTQIKGKSPSVWRGAALEVGRSVGVCSRRLPEAAKTSHPS